MSDLFAVTDKDTTPQSLAVSMRPASLDEFAGQKHLLGPGKMLRAMIESRNIISLIITGPPGVGKTTFARLLARIFDAHFEEFSAVTSKVEDVRRVVSEARERRRLYNRQTVLFVDEFHRFNKLQQDAFLPHMESGVIVLIGATTENPYFAINSALLSRSRICKFNALEPGELEQVINRALDDKVRGLGGYRIELQDGAMDRIIRAANGDARVALSVLDLSWRLAPKGKDGAARISTAVVSEAAAEKMGDYDRAGDQHYDLISAFIKSMRGSDPDAAVYWLARMLSGGEDPRFPARRMVIFASEDVGNADPLALPVAIAAMQAVEKIGMPEAMINLGQAATYLASAPKSNASYMAISGAMAAVENEPWRPIPAHLHAGPRVPTPGEKTEDYKYPHDFENAWVEQNYFPQGMEPKVFYHPTDRGYERKIAARLSEFRRKEGT